MSRIILEPLESCVLIDDNEIDNFINSTILKSNGVNNLKVFTSVSKALSFFRDSKISPSLILLDIRMPFSDGFDFVDKFNELENLQTKIAFLSSFITPEDQLKASNLNLKLIEKPLTIEKLLNIL